MPGLSETTSNKSTTGRRKLRNNSKGSSDATVKKLKSEQIWQQYYDELKLFYHKNGHIQVPITYLTANGRKLNNWLAHQRIRRKEGKLSEEQIAMLDELGMVWGHHDELAWENLLTHLKQYIIENETTNVPSTYVCEDGYKLGACLGWYKNKYSKDELPEEYISVFEKLGVSLIPLWDKYLAETKAYFEKYGVTSFPVDYCDEEGYNLYAWLVRQKMLYEKGKLSAYKIKKLEETGCFVTSTVNRRQFREQKIWLEKYEFVLKYNEEHPGEPIGPDVIYDGVEIRRWLSYQIWLIKNKKIDHERYEMLQKLNIPNFVFDEAVINARDLSKKLEKETKRNKRIENWNVRFDEIKAFADRNGRLPMFTDGETSMCIWVKRQRIRYIQGNLTDEQANKLRSLGVELSVVESQNDKWLRYYESLKRFISENGRMPKQTKKDPDEKVLSRWVINQHNRYAKGTMPENEVEMLRAIGVVL